jgi:uncharacterized protein YdbL (DUF1318 family)
MTMDINDLLSTILGEKVELDPAAVLAEAKAVLSSEPEPEPEPEPERELEPEPEPEPAPDEGVITAAPQPAIEDDELASLFDVVRGVEPVPVTPPPAADEDVETPEIPDPEPEPVTTPVTTEVTSLVTDTTDVGKKLAAAATLPSFVDDELMSALDIRQFGTLVTLTTNRWHAKVKDRFAAKAASAATGANDEAFEARKRLLVGADAELRRIHKAIDDARTKHYEMTLPWSTNGVNDVGRRAGARLLPNTRFMEYVQVMAKAKAEMEAALNVFVPLYPQLVQQAAQNLKGSFDPKEYPPASTIAKHFALEFEFHPVAVGKDFEGILGAQAEKLALALEMRNRTMLENAMQDMWVRLTGVIDRAVDRFGTPDAIFQHSLIDNLRGLVEDLKHLNVTKDPRIEKVRQEIDKRLTKHEAPDIREDAGLRKLLGEEARRIRSMLDAIARGGSV